MAFASAPAVPLTVYQRHWVMDDSRFKIGCFTRQGGKSFGTSLEAVLDCLEHVTTWVLLSAGERQSKELIGKAKLHAAAAGRVIEVVESEFLGESGFKYKMLEIAFPNGSRIVGLPANPDTARGWSANILLDEFALHKDSRAIWTALFPSITRGYKIRVISTFRGKTNKFYDLFFAAPTLQRFTGQAFEYVGDRGGWSKHLVTIHDAVAMGLELKDDEGQPCEPEDLRLALADDEAWDEEFCCIPSDEASAFLPHELIGSVEDQSLIAEPAWVGKLVAAAIAGHEAYKATQVEAKPPVEALDGIVWPSEMYLGQDIGRKKHLSIIWLDGLVGGVLRTVAAIVLKQMPFGVQHLVLHALLSLPQIRRACIDSTGIGAQLAEEAQDAFGEYRVEGIGFTQASKEALATGLKRNFDDRASAIPVDATIRSSLHSVKQYATTTKHFRFDAEASDATGHADHFWAKALAVHAHGGRTSGPIEHQTAVPRRFSEHRGAY